MPIYGFTNQNVITLEVGGYVTVFPHGFGIVLHFSAMDRLSCIRIFPLY